MNVAVLGVGNIGKFHIREYLDNQCNIVAILGSSSERVKIKQELIQKEYGIYVNGYFDLNKLLLRENVDAVSVCTPPDFHYSQVKICLEKNLNVLCEKPFIIGKNNLKLAKELIRISKKKNKILSVNTQWPFVLDEIKPFIGVEPIDNFYFSMEEGLKGIGILTDGLPHANSMLIKLLGEGIIKNINYLEKDEEKNILEFDYIYANLKCKVKYEIKFKKNRPRTLEFSINNKIFTKKFLSDNSLALQSNNQLIKINDPFKMSLKNFIDSTANKSKPFIGSQEIIYNLYLQNQILKKYYS